MSNLIHLICAIALILYLPYAADLRAGDLTLLYANSQKLVTAPMSALSSVLQHRPGQGRTPSVRNSLRRSATPQTVTRRLATLRTLTHVDSLVDDLNEVRRLVLFLLD